MAERYTKRELQKLLTNHTFHKGEPPLETIEIAETVVVQCIAAMEAAENLHYKLTMLERKSISFECSACGKDLTECKCK